MKKQTYKLILASGSPRRKELLAKSGFEFDVRSYDVDESYPKELPIDEIAEYLAIKKAKFQQASLSEDEVMITADTIVAFNGKEYGKPSDRDDSIRTLLMLSNNHHDVYTGVCICNKNKSESFTCKSVVKFSEISQEEAEWYYDSCNPSDKAGAYGIQDWIGFSKVEWINGSYTNILGLPLAQTLNVLKLFLKDK